MIGLGVSAAAWLAVVAGLVAGVVRPKPWRFVQNPN
jgi:hypothetical protein